MIYTLSRYPHPEEFKALIDPFQPQSILVTSSSEKLQKDKSDSGVGGMS